MKNFLILTFIAIAFTIPNSLALTITPEPITKPIILTGCPFKIKQLLWYDICQTPATNMKVYYNITFGLFNSPEQMYYPSQCRLDEVGVEVNRAVYQKITDKKCPGFTEYFWKDGDYTGFTKAIDSQYLTYDKTYFKIHPDFPFFFSFSLSGSPQYLNVKWNGSYNITPGSCIPNRPLSLRCYFNGEFIGEINPSVKYLPKKEYISTVSSPNYRYCKNVICPDENCNPHDSCSSYSSVFNVLSCNSFDSDHRWLNYWNNINFRPIHFEASRTAPSVVTVGEEFKIKIDVSNRGLFVDNYTIEVISTNPSVINVIDGRGKIENLAADCPKATFPTTNYLCSPTSTSFEVRAIPLVAGSAQLIVTVRSDISGITLVLPSIDVKSGVKSLSEFNWTGIAQIMILAVIILILFKKYL